MRPEAGYAKSQKAAAMQEIRKVAHTSQHSCYDNADKCTARKPRL
jgi:hypothetical protein